MKKLLLFLLGVAALPLHAQSPGGVNGADLWYKAVRHIKPSGALPLAGLLRRFRGFNPAGTFKPG